MGEVCRIPLPAQAGRPPAGGDTDSVALVAAFLDATEGVSCDQAAALAGVRPQTIRNWRRHLPRWLKARTARRLHAHLTGETPPPAEAGFRRVFGQMLRRGPAEL